jgi:hypothetical protein
VEPAYCERFALLLEQYVRLCPYSANELRKQQNVIHKLQYAAERVVMRRDVAKMSKKDNKKEFLEEMDHLNDAFFSRLVGGTFQISLFPTMKASRLVVEKCNFMSSKMAPVYTRSCTLAPLQHKLLYETR